VQAVERSGFARVLERSVLMRRGNIRNRPFILIAVSRRHRFRAKAYSKIPEDGHW
jgi:hypothetical protein